jgi:membrane fusion protein, heavy metal efflux system
MQQNSLASSAGSLTPSRAMVALAAAALIGGGAYWLLAAPERPAPGALGETKTAAVAVSSSNRQSGQSLHLTTEQRRMLAIHPVAMIPFRTEQRTEGKIAINEDRSTPVFSPYAGRVTRLAAKPGDKVKAGQPLFFIEAADMVQTQNELLGALSNLQKANSRVSLTEIVERQNRTLFESKAGSLREMQTAQAELHQARSERRSAEAALEAARNRLAILGKTQDEIAAFEEKGRINPETPILAPIDGTVIQRKVGPGQYVSYTSTGSLDPVFTIGDLDTVWVVAYVREREAPKIRVGHRLDFSVLAYPEVKFQGRIDYVSTSLDPGTRRLTVRATVDNTDLRLKPEMFAAVHLFGEDAPQTAAVPIDAVILEAESARVWVETAQQTFEKRNIRTGIVQDGMVQVIDGLSASDRVVTKGGIFVDRVATGG